MKGNGMQAHHLLKMAFQARWRELKKLGWQSRKPTGLSNLHTYLKPGKKKKDGVPGRDFFVGEEELMKYLDRVDLGTFERYSSASMSSDVAYRYLAQRCYTEATRKQPRRQQRSHEATKPRSQASGQSRREAATTERGSGERSQGKDDTGASTELGGEGMLAYYVWYTFAESLIVYWFLMVTSRPLKPGSRRSYSGDSGVKMAFQARWRELKKLGWQSRKPTGLSNLHTYLKPGKKKKDGVPGRDFFVGEEELMKYLDRVDLGTFERYSSASMSSDVAYRYLAQRCYTEATRKQPRRQQRSHEATKPQAKQAAKAGVRLQRPREKWRALAGQG
ncbi:hypothetical protein GQ600_2674 [Phytophthora cactorum]|nr:hypothetical protein GQ600_2674 [Phytophthora cactorum]